MSKDYIQILVEKLISGKISLEELDDLLSFSEDEKYQSILNTVVDKYLKTTRPPEIDPNEYDELRIKIDQYVAQIPKKTVRIFYLKKIALIAAVSILFFIVGLLFFTNFDGLPWNNQSKLAQHTQQHAENTYVSIGNSRVVPLDSLPIGEQIVSNGIILKKKSKGELIYETTHELSNVTSVLLSIVTATKDSYKITLPDGTKVWLNAQSTLRFPSRFANNIREVFAEGELFFEVTPASENNFKPFVVKSERQKITVTGTSFNLMTYPDQRYAITSLIEGKVQVESGDSRMLLKPGEQGTVDKEQMTLQRHSFDVDQIQAWRDGYFVYKETPLRAVLEDLSKWYGFDISKLKKIPVHATVTAKIDRDIPLTAVLKSLEEITSYEFKIYGNKLIINN